MQQPMVRTRVLPVAWAAAAFAGVLGVRSSRLRVDGVVVADIYNQLLERRIAAVWLVCTLLVGALVAMVVPPRRRVAVVVHVAAFVAAVIGAVLTVRAVGRGPDMAWLGPAPAEGASSIGSLRSSWDALFGPAWVLGVGALLLAASVLVEGPHEGRRWGRVPLVVAAGAVIRAAVVARWQAGSLARWHVWYEPVIALSVSGVLLVGSVTSVRLGRNGARRLGVVLTPVVVVFLLVGA